MLKKQQGFSKLIILIIILIIIAGGVLAWQFWPERNAPTEQQPVVDGTADWKTYRNEELGFEFAYSREWLLEEENNLVTLRNKIGSFYTYCGASDTPTKGVMVMVIEALNKGLSVDDKIKECEDNSGSCLPEVISLDGQKAVELFDVGGIPNYYKRVYTVKNNKFYMFYLTISCDINSPENSPDVQKIFNQILSTFKFL